MNQRLLIAVLTAVGFAAGFAAREFTESGPAVPAPPTAGAEFSRNTGAPSEPGKRRRAPTYTDKDRAKLAAAIARLRPQIDSYRTRIGEISAEFERNLLPILTPEQRAKFDALEKKSAERRAKGERELAESAVLTDERIFHLQQHPLWNALWNVAINWRLERLTRDFQLSSGQQAKVRVLLELRRTKFLALVDSTPPPTITLSDLATQADKLAEPRQK